VPRGGLPKTNENKRFCKDGTLNIPTVSQEILTDQPHPTNQASIAAIGFDALLRVRVEADLPDAIRTAALRRRIRPSEFIRQAIRAALVRDGIALADSVYSGEAGREASL